MGLPLLNVHASSSPPACGPSTKPISALALQSRPGCTKRRRSGSSALDQPEGAADVCFDFCSEAWDFPLSRAEKVRRLLLLFEDETDASCAAASRAEELYFHASERTKELEVEEAKLRARVLQLEHEVDAARVQPSRPRPMLPSSEEEAPSVGSPQPAWAVNVRSSSSGSSSKSGHDSASDDEDEEGLQFGFHRDSEGKDSDGDSDAPPPMAGSRDAPSDNLLAQLLLSAPTVPMLPRMPLGGVVVSAAPKHLLSMVTPRCPPATPALALHRLGAQQAPLGVGCLNLGGLRACTPRDICAKQSAQTSRRLDPQLAAALATPRPLPSNLPQSRLLSSVAAVRWGGVDAVEWLEFVAREDCADPTCDAVANQHQAASMFGQVTATPRAASDGEFVLQKGEFIQVLRGCAEVADGRVADWIVLVTSKLRSKKLGQPGGSNTTLSFIAAPGSEISGVVLADNGRLEGVRQRLLVNDPS